MLNTYFFLIFLLSLLMIILSNQDLKILNELIFIFLVIANQLFIYSQYQNNFHHALLHLRHLEYYLLKVMVIHVFFVHY